MSRRAVRPRGRPLLLLLLVCALHLLSGQLHAADAPDRSTRQHRAMRRVDSGTDQVEDRTNAIDQPLDQALQLKYYDVVQVDLVHSLPAAPDADTLALLGAGAGEGQDPEQGSDSPPPSSSSSTPAATKSESAKTLADQVAEGKYGLIHRELFQRRPQRLGVLNYRRNEEVPLDDERNYGGLRPDEIWLAEDHLLVLKGGSISFGSNRSGAEGPPTAWQPIDDYRAPDRQVQIPANPAVPPPFPVQLRENGPIEFIRGRQVPAFNPFTNESAFLFTNKAFPVIRPEDFGGQNILAGPAAHNATGQHHTGLQYPPPVNPPPVSDNRTYSNPFLKLPPPPGLPPFPGAGGSLDDVRNRTGLPGLPLPPGDEDDPSLYYPPPYTFEYRGNYTNPVPPGPLVPGIILPPPPNFFILKPANGTANVTARPAERPKPVVTKPPKHYVTVRPHPSTTTVAPTPPPPPPPPPPPSINSVTPTKISPTRVEIQKAVLKTFVPVLEVYGTPPKPPAKPASKRPRPKPTQPPPTIVTTVQTPSTKLHKIPSQEPGTVGQRQPIYAEYFDVRTSTLPPGWNEVSPVTPHLPRTYLPVSTKTRPEPARPVATAPDYYGYPSPIEQFHREVQTIRQTLQIYEKANRHKAGRTSKAQHYHHHHQPSTSLTNLSLSFDGNVYRTLFPEELPQQVSYQSPQPPPPPPQLQHQLYKPSYEPQPAPPAYVYRPTVSGVVSSDLPTGYYVTTTDYGRHGRTGYGEAQAAPAPPPQYYQPHHVQSAAPPPPPQPDLSYIAPVILNNGASGYNRRPDFDPGSTTSTTTTTTTKSYLILDHRLPAVGSGGATRLRPDRQRLAELPSPYLYRSGGGPEQGTGPVRNRYLEGDILVNYKHPLPVLNPDSEFLPYHHRLKVRKRQNVRGAGEQKPRYLNQPLYNHR
uniref:Uncharacterized protein n=1 Tax=Anopheles epiroticus TaxID=199890 RepID=A0A182PT68_9DIPT